ncbi:MAG: ABC-F type ribosomal protection protein [Lachnospiraceae bacterium]|nr:ABC-F type ribosomal protection protein [Lachnospiraceae bacterium]
MILSCSKINRAYGSDVIIKDASLLINAHEKVAVVGNNGAGKTTLLDMLTGTEPPDSGTVTMPAGVTSGYLKQINDIDSDDTVIAEMMKIIEPVIRLEEALLSVQDDMKHAEGEELEKLYERYSRLTHEYEMADGYEARSRVTGILKGLGFAEEEFGKQVRMLSGGEKTRLFLGKILISQPDIIFLDEPTNHLDLSSIEWLETYLTNYYGTVVIVSHDRYFLDRIVNKVIDIDMGHVETFTGNYTEYAEKKKMLYDARVKAYIKQQETIRHQEEVIEKLQSFNREKSIKRAESRKKMLGKIDRLEKPVQERTDMYLKFIQTAASGKDVLTVENLGKTFDDGETLFRDLQFELKRGEHVAIIGDNGTGKTTILKMLTGGVTPTNGKITFGTGVEIAYFDQEHQILDRNKTIFDEIQDDYPNMNNTEVRDLLAAFMFTGDEVFKRIGDLSGGEVGRVSLAKLMLSRANLLILDEPTNHLDIMSKEILEDAVRDFEGTVLYVSHDRYFINRTANRILNLTHEKLLNYIGNYDYYLEKREAMETYKGVASGSDNALFEKKKDNSSNGASDWKASKQKAAEKKRRMQKIERIEEEIHKLEKEVQEIEAEFDKTENQTNPVRLGELQKQLDVNESKLEKLLEEWETLLEEDESDE